MVLMIKISLRWFVFNAKLDDYYGRNFMSYNIHQLLHISQVNILLIIKKMIIPYPKGIITEKEQKCFYDSLKV